MTKYLRIMGLCVSLSVFVALLGLLTPLAVPGAAAGVCPCVYDLVPKTQECWVTPFPTPPSHPLSWSSSITSPPDANQECITSISDISAPDTFIALAVRVDLDGTYDCFLRTNELPPMDCPTIFTVPDLTLDELEACQCDLQAYTTALNAVDGISVSGGPPYECSDPPLECPQPPSIPTLNQWGMFIMAGVLGLFAVIGLFVMRRSGVVRPSN